MARKKKAKKVKGMLLDAASLCVHKLTADEEGRYAINNVKLEPDGTTAATTGYALIAVQPGGEDPADFPEVGNPVAIPKEGVLIPRDVCADAIKAMPKRSVRPVLANALVTRWGKDGVELATTDLSRTRKVGAPKVEGTFPDWRDMFAHENRDRPVGFTVGVRALKRLLDTISAHLSVGSDHGPSLRFEFSPTKRKILAGASEGLMDAPVLVRGSLKADRGGRVLALLAPMRVKHMSDEAPEVRPEFSDWEKGVLGWEDRDDEAPDVPALRHLADAMSRMLAEIEEADTEDSAPTGRFRDLLLAAADELADGVTVDAELHAVTDARDIVAETAQALRGVPVEESVEAEPDEPAEDESQEVPADDPPEEDPAPEEPEEIIDDTDSSAPGDDLDDILDG
jgi:hypothetical protein